MSESRRRSLRLLARFATALVVLLLLLASAAWALGGVKFGATPSGDALVRIHASPQWRDGAFRNVQPMWNDYRGMLTGMFATAADATPQAPVPVERSNGAALATPPASGLRVTWFGHSSTLIEIDGVRILTDPIWSDRPSPVAVLGPQRYFAPPIGLRDLPPIDAIIISHDHYDHLDRATIAWFANTSTTFITPLGVGSHLRRWGIPDARIIEMDWWQRHRIGALEIVATPARHASGRVFPQGDQTLWAGYALIGATHRAFYSGDTGLHDALRDVGERLGPFDVALIESGQYNASWPDWHLGPEQAVLASRLVRARTLLPVHWGLFTLAFHGWTEPVERVLAAATCQGVTVLAPMPGQSIDPLADTRPTRWWPSLPWRTAAEMPVIATRSGNPQGRLAPLALAAACVAQRNR